jgi:acyl-CoA-binding protein
MKLHSVPAIRTHIYSCGYGNGSSRANGIVQGKAKYNKWKEVVDSGISQKEADDKYIEVGEAIIAKYDK